MLSAPLQEDLDYYLAPAATAAADVMAGESGGYHGSVRHAVVAHGVGVCRRHAVLVAPGDVWGTAHSADGVERGVAGREGAGGRERFAVSAD